LAILSTIAEIPAAHATGNTRQHSLFSKQYAGTNPENPSMSREKVSE